MEAKYFIVNIFSSSGDEKIFLSLMTIYDGCLLTRDTGGYFVIGSVGYVAFKG